VPGFYNIGTKLVPDWLPEDFPQAARKLPEGFPKASQGLSKVSRQPHQESEHRLHAIEMTFEGTESVSFLTFIHSLAPVQAATGGDADGGGRLGYFFYRFGCVEGSLVLMALRCRKCPASPSLSV